MGLIIDIAFELPKDMQAALESRIRQVVCEPPPLLFYARVKVLDSSLPDVLVYGNIY